MTTDSDINIQQMKFQEFEEFLVRSQKNFNKRIQKKAEEAGVSCVVRVIVDIHTNPVLEKGE